jgi:hypothetical protein
LLLFCDREQRILVSGDRSTLRQHVANHRATGHRTYGVAVISRGYPFAQIVDDLVLMLECSDANEWIDDWIYVPSLASGE